MMEKVVEVPDISKGLQLPPFFSAFLTWTVLLSSSRIHSIPSQSYYSPQCSSAPTLNQIPLTSIVL